MKSIIKKFNKLVKKTIFKVQNKTNNNFKISNFNKYLIFFIASLFLYIFYLLIPLLYDKTWVQTNIESKLLKEFKINLSASADISYRILPAPYFLIKDSKILINTNEQQKSIAEIKEFKVFLKQGNFFNKEKMDIQKIIINDANFSLLRNDLKLLNDFKNKKLSKKKIKIKNSNIFLKDNLGETISIIKIDKAILYFDIKKFINFFNLKGEVFNVPFIFDLTNHDNLNKYENINFNSKLLKLNISDKSIEEKNKLISGENYISLLNSKINTKYNVKEKLIIFESFNSKINNSQIHYNGEISTNPFNLDLNIRLDNHKISKLFKINPILIELFKSRLLFNKNISLNTSIIIESNSKNTIFQKAKVNLDIINGKINFDKTKFINDKIGSIQLINSNILSKNNDLVLNSDLLIDIKNSDRLFSFLNTNKSSRKKIKNILINLDYDFLNNQIKFNNVKIENSEVNDVFLTIIDGFSDNDLNNFNNSRRLINELLEDYEG
jgi:hypothetical protein